MAGIDLKSTGIDPWAKLFPSVGQSGGGSGGGVDIAGAAVGLFTGDWLSTGLSILGGLGGGKTEVSAASSTSQGALNTSGWVIGEGTAEGADLSASQNMGAIGSMPWYVWAAGTLVVIAIIKKAV